MLFTIIQKFIMMMMMMVPPLTPTKVWAGRFIFKIIKYIQFNQASKQKKKRTGWSYRYKFLTQLLGASQRNKCEKAVDVNLQFSQIFPAVESSKHNPLNCIQRTSTHLIDKPITSLTCHKAERSRRGHSRLSASKAQVQPPAVF